MPESVEINEVDRWMADRGFPYLPHGIAFILLKQRPWFDTVIAQPQYVAGRGNGLNLPYANCSSPSFYGYQKSFGTRPVVDVHGRHFCLPAHADPL